MEGFGGIPEINLPEERGGKIAMILGSKAFIGIVALVAGLAAGVFLLSDPLKGILGMTKAGEKGGPARTAAPAPEVTALQSQLNEFRSVVGTPQEAQAIKEELEKRREMQPDLAMLEEKLVDLQDQELRYDKLQEDSAKAQQEYAALQTQLEQLKGELSLLEERKNGLSAEAQRLEGQVGKLSEAEQRSAALKQTLETDLNRLLVRIKESPPLSPLKYRREVRLARADAVKEELQNAKWVSDHVLSEYSDLVQTELEMSRDEVYFYAKVPVKGKETTDWVWAECLSIGNKTVYYRTADGKVAGQLVNIASAGSVPKWEFQSDLPREVRTEILAELDKRRPPDGAEKLMLLAQNEAKERSSQQQ